MADSSAALLRQQLLELRGAQEIVLKAKCDEIGSIMDELTLVTNDISDMSKEDAKWSRRLNAAKRSSGVATPGTPPAASPPQQQQQQGGAAQQGSNFAKNIALGLFDFNETLSKKR